MKKERTEQEGKGREAKVREGEEKRREGEEENPCQNINESNGHHWF